MDNNFYNNNYFNEKSFVNEDLEKAKSLAKSLDQDEHKSAYNSKIISKISGIMAILTGFGWIILLFLCFIAMQLGLFGIENDGGFSGLILLLFQFPLTIISFIFAIIAVFSDVNLISGLGMYSSLHLVILYGAAYLARGRIFLFLLLFLLGFLLVFLFLKWLKNRQK